MGKIRIVANDGSSPEYDETLVHDLLRQGVVRPGSPYWKEGMTEWRPLSEWLAGQSKAYVPPRAPPVPVVPREGTAVLYRLQRSLEPLATITQILRAFFILVALFKIACLVAVFIHCSLGDFKSIVTDYFVIKVSTYITIGLLVTRALPSLMWLYRASANCHGLAPDMKFSAGLAVGSHFIPFANLVIPFLVYQEIWKISLNPRDWKSAKNSTLINIWWGLNLFTGLVFPVLLLMNRVHHGKNTTEISAHIFQLATIQIASILAQIVCTTMTMMIVYIITRNQLKLTASR